MRVLGLSMPLITPGADIASMILRASEQVGGLRDRDIVVISSSALATAQGRVKKLASVRPSPRAKQLAKRSDLEPEFVEIVLREADKVLGVAKGAIATLKDGMLCANAGVDHTNAPLGSVTLMPEKPDQAAEEILRALKKRVEGRLGVIIADSHVQPLRLGTVGQAIGVAGMEPAIDCRGKRDLYGRRLRITFRGIADQLASAAQVEMGEADERVPAVVIRWAKVEFTDQPRTSVKIQPNKCLFFAALKLGKR
jgi:coenzyme F420-0:L-glutamate ligase